MNFWSLPSGISSTTCHNPPLVNAPVSDSGLTLFQAVSRKTKSGQQAGKRKHEQTQCRVQTRQRSLTPALVNAHYTCQYCLGLQAQVRTMLYTNEVLGFVNASLQTPV